MVNITTGIKIKTTKIINIYRKNLYQSKIDTSFVDFEKVKQFIIIILS